MAKQLKIGNKWRKMSDGALGQPLVQRSTPEKHVHIAARGRSVAMEGVEIDTSPSASSTLSSASTSRKEKEHVCPTVETGAAATGGSHLEEVLRDLGAASKDLSSMHVSDSSVGWTSANLKPRRSGSFTSSKNVSVTPEERFAVGRYRLAPRRRLNRSSSLVDLMDSVHDDYASSQPSTEKKTGVNFGFACGESNTTSPTKRSSHRRSSSLEPPTRRYRRETNSMHLPKSPVSTLLQADATTSTDRNTQPIDRTRRDTIKAILKLPSRVTIALDHNTSARKSPLRPRKLTVDDAVARMKHNLLSSKPVSHRRATVVAVPTRPPPIVLRRRSQSLPIHFYQQHPRTVTNSTQWCGEQSLLRKNWASRVRRDCMAKGRRRSVSQPIYLANQSEERSSGECSPASPVCPTRTPDSPSVVPPPFFHTPTRLAPPPPSPAFHVISAPTPSPIGRRRHLDRDESVPFATCSPLPIRITEDETRSRASSGRDREGMSIAAALAATKYQASLSPLGVNRKGPEYDKDRERKERGRNDEDQVLSTSPPLSSPPLSPSGFSNEDGNKKRRGKKNVFAFGKLKLETILQASKRKIVLQELLLNSEGDLPPENIDHVTAKLLIRWTIDEGSSRLRISAARRLASLAWPDECLDNIRDMVLESGALLHISALCKEGKVSVHRSIAPEELTDMALLTQGAMGRVCTAVWRGHPVAVKCITEDCLNFDIHNFRSEVALMTVMSHPNLLPCYGAFLSSTQCLFVSPYAENGDLQAYLRLNPLTLSLKQKVNICRDIASALVHLHRHDILHRDLKTPNILLDADMTAWVADFGEARVARTGLRMTCDLGTTAWCAPEVFSRDGTEGSVYDAKGTSADIWSFGIIMYELFTEKHPYGDMRSWDIPLKVLNGWRLSMPVDVHPLVKELVDSCWKEPQERPAASFLAEQFQKISDEL